ncbi:MAG: nucleoside-diphosphate-sugar epimerase [Paraglaciecola sp.]|jgi:nucleoside-diphosphate-sugar epimerase
MKQQSNESILITGANGFIGRSLMDYYRTNGVSVVGVDLQGNGDDIHEADIAKPETFKELLKSCSVVIHTAALVSNAMSDLDMWRVNVKATSTLIKAAEEHQVKRFVQISSIVVFGNKAKGELDEEHPVHADGGSYVLTKLASEHTVLSAQTQGNIEVVVIRPGDVYGPGSRPWVILPLEMIKKNQFMLPAMGKGYFRPIYIDDLVRGITKAASSDKVAGQILILSCKGNITTKEFFKNHCSWLGKKDPITVPTSVALILSYIVTGISKLFGKANEASAASIYQLSTESWYSIDKAERLLGWKPEISLTEGMERSREWAEKQGYL